MVSQRIGPACAAAMIVVLSVLAVAQAPRPSIIVQAATPPPQRNILLSPLNTHGQPQSAALQGVWKIVRTSLTTADRPSFVDYGQPSLLLFTARHYSLMYVEGNKARQMFSDPARPTDAEKIAAFDTFVGHSGTYSVADSVIAMEIEIAKLPNLMGPELRNTFARFEYQVTGDTMLLTRRNPRGAFTMQLVRVK